MAESYITRKGGGGGAINGLIESYKVKAGETITAGDFVDYLNNIVNTSLSSETTFSNVIANNIKGVLINSSTVLVAYSDSTNSSAGKVLLLTINPNGSITTGTTVTFKSSSINDINLISINNSSYLLSYRNFGNNNYAEFIIITISGSTINLGTVNVITSIQIYLSYLTKIIDDKALFIYRRVSDSFPTVSILNINGTTVTEAGTATINSSACNIVVSSLLSENKVLVSYNTSSNNYGYSKILTISGNSFTQGSDLNFSTNLQQLEQVAINADKAFVVYRDLNNNNYGTLRLLTINNTTITAGTPQVFASETISVPHMILLSTNKVLLCSYLQVSNGKYYVLDVLENSFIISESGTFKNAGLWFINTVKYDDEKVLIAYRLQGNNEYFGTALTLSLGYTEEFVFPATEQIFGVAKTGGTGGQTIDVYVDETAMPFKLKELLKSLTVAPGETITAGTFIDYLNFLGTTVFNSANTIAMKACLVDTNKVLIAYRDVGNSSYGTAIIATINNTTITFGSEYVFFSGTTMVETVIQLDTNKVLIGYRDFSASSWGRAVIATISGTDISFGSQSNFASDNITEAQILLIDTNKLLSVYRDTNSGYYGRATVGTISGTSITWTGFTNFNSSRVDSLSLAFVDTNKAVVVYTDFATSSNGTAQVLTVSGTSITVGTKYIFNNASTGSKSVILIDTNKLFISFGDSANSTYGTGIIGTVSGSAITFGSEYIFNPGITYAQKIIKLATNKALVVYWDYAALNYGAIIGSVNGTAITWGNETVLSPKATSGGYFESILLETNKVLFAYNNENNSNFGTTSIGFIDGNNFSQLVINTTQLKVGGLAKTGGTAGQTIEVYTNE